MTQVVTLTMNGQELSGRDDETVLQVAREHNIPIPTLCQMDGLSEVGACRLCLVEIAGSSRLQPACTTRVTEGMTVQTESAALHRYRCMTVEMLFAEGNHVCSVCVENGHCELQDQAVALGIDHIRLPALYPQRTVDASHPRFSLDHNRCILCTRCVRVCDEIEGAHVWDVMGRGTQSQIIAGMHQPWGAAADCTTCGKCVQACPTGALFEKGHAVGEMQKRHQFLATLVQRRGGGR